MRLSTVFVASALSFAGLGGALPVADKNMLTARFADSDAFRGRRAFIGDQGELFTRGCCMSTSRPPPPPPPPPPAGGRGGGGTRVPATTSSAPGYSSARVPAHGRPKRSLPVTDENMLAARFADSDAFAELDARAFEDLTARGPGNHVAHGSPAPPGGTARGGAPAPAGGAGRGGAPAPPAGAGRGGSTSRVPATTSHAPGGSPAGGPARGVSRGKR